MSPAVGCHLHFEGRRREDDSISGLRLELTGVLNGKVSEMAVVIGLGNNDPFNRWAAALRVPRAQEGFRVAPSAVQKDPAYSVVHARIHHGMCEFPESALK